MFDIAEMESIDIERWRKDYGPISVSLTIASLEGDREVSWVMAIRYVLVGGDPFDVEAVRVKECRKEFGIGICRNRRR